MACKKKNVHVSGKEELKAGIRIIYDDNYQRHGSPGITVMLQGQGGRACRFYTLILTKKRWI